MIKFSKLTLFILFFTMTVCAGITTATANWEDIISKNGLSKELFQPLLFIALALYFMFPYVKKIKEEKNKE